MLNVIFKPQWFPKNPESYRDVEVFEELFDDGVECVSGEVGQVRPSGVEHEVPPPAHLGAEVAGPNGQFRLIPLETEKATFHDKHLTPGGAGEKGS